MTKFEVKLDPEVQRAEVPTMIRDFIDIGNEYITIKLSAKAALSFANDIEFAVLHGSTVDIAKALEKQG